MTVCSSVSIGTKRVLQIGNIMYATSFGTNPKWVNVYMTKLVTLSGCMFLLLQVIRLLP